MYVIIAEVPMYQVPSAVQNENNTKNGKHATEYMNHALFIYVCVCFRVKSWRALARAEKIHERNLSPSLAPAYRALHP